MEQRYKDGFETIDLYNQTLDLETRQKIQEVSYQVEIDILYTDAKENI